MRVKIRRRYWNLIYTTLPRGIDGECDPPDKKNKSIRVDKKMRGQDELETLLHEMDHACQWDISEEAIEEAAHDKARILWEMGWRKVGDTDVSDSDRL